MPKLLLPNYGQHITFLGATGSGKSVLACKMLEQYERYLAIDTQDSLDIKGKVIKNPASLKLQYKLQDRIKYTPQPDFISSGYFNRIFKEVLGSSTKRHPNPRIIYIDEIFHIGFGQSFPSWLPKSIATARQRQLSFWISTQRPRCIPMPVLSEASKIYVFYLNKEDDVKYVSSFARTDKKLLEQSLYEQKDDYSFIEIDARKGTWQKYPKLKL